MAFNYNDYLNKQLNQTNSYYDQQKAAELARMKAQQTSALAKVNQQQQQTKQQYYGQRNQADVTNQQNVNRLRELMAANGLNSSGENITANVALNNQRQNSLNSLNTQEQAQMNDYSNQINDINSPDKMNAYLAQWNAEKAKAVGDVRTQAEQMANTYAQQEKQYQLQKQAADLQKAQFEWQKQQQAAQLALAKAKASSGGSSRRSSSAKSTSKTTSNNALDNLYQQYLKSQDYKDSQVMAVLKANNDRVPLGKYKQLYQY